MKRNILTVALAAMLMSAQCSAQPQSNFEEFADNLDSSLDYFDDAMESLDDAMESLGDAIEEMVDSATEFGDSTVIIKHRGNSIITYYNKSANINGKSIKLSSKDPMLTRRFPVSPYNALSVNYSFKVVMCDTVDSIVVRVNEKLKNYLNVRYNNGKLHIGLNHIDGISCEDGAVFGFVYLPYNLKLNYVELNGSSCFTTKLPIRTSTFNIDLSGASNFSADINAGIISFELSGASIYEGDVTASTFNVDLSGSSKIRTKAKAQKLNAELSGASNMFATLDIKNLDVDNSGASKIKLKGKASSMELELSGSSELYSELPLKSVKGSMSGASKATLQCNEVIDMELSGASHLRYYGNAKDNITTSRTAKAYRIKK